MVSLSVWLQFSNLCGTLYKQGNLLFTPDGNSVLSPVGNRISVLDLVKYVSMRDPANIYIYVCVSLRTCSFRPLISAHMYGSCNVVAHSHKCITLPFENRKNISRLALSPNGHTLLSIDEGTNHHDTYRV
jgi:periodic tryptophan protein 2